MALAHAGTDFPPRASRCLCMNFACLLQICDKERYSSHATSTTTTSAVRDVRNRSRDGRMTSWTIQKI